MMQFFASCPKGIESLLIEELKTFAASDIKATDAGVGFRGPAEVAYRACLWSRLASRVFLEIDRFPAEDPDEVYAGVKAIPWSDHLNTHSTFCIDASLRGTRMDHSQYVALRSKDAIVDHFRERTGARPSVLKENPDLRVNVHVRGREAVVSIDLSGSSLHERGYRERAGLAPIKENLAAAILWRMGWREIFAAGGDFIDPMCGAGTFAIEAALWAFDSAPGLYRKYWGFAGWNGFERDIWRSLVREANERRKAAQGKELKILGFDGDNRVIPRARDNASRAGVGERVLFEQRGISDWDPEMLNASKPGLLLANPPYGERMGEITELTGLYTQLGGLMKERFTGWKAGIFTGNPNLGKVMGIRSHKQYALWNGSIPCELLVFDIQEKNLVKEKAARSLEVSGETVALSEGATAFRNRLLKNYRHISKWAKREKLECYRVYDADIPDYNVAVDLYGDCLVIQEYAPPLEIPQEKTERKLQEILLVAPEVLKVPRDLVFVKTRTRQRGTKQYQRQEFEEVWREVEENGHRFLVNLSNYLDTGLFLDHRITRKLLEEEAEGKSFLNLFAYTGSASVYAAAGGAKRTVTVDLSNTYLNWAQKNMEINGFSGPEHDFIQADCRIWMKTAREKFDLIFIDPPTFSNSKKLRDPFQVQEDYLFLLEHAARILNPGGKIYFSNNFRKFRMDDSAVAELGLVAREISRRTLPVDFMGNPRIHRCWLLEPIPVNKVIAHEPHHGRKKEKPKKITHD